MSKQPNQPIRPLLVVLRQTDFACSQCPQRFPTLTALYEHMPAHRVEQRPEGCNLCGKSFETEKERTRHMNSQAHFQRHEDMRLREEKARQTSASSRPDDPPSK